MAHPLVLALFVEPSSAAAAARALRAQGVRRESVSIVARTHEEEGVLAHAADASPGSEIEDSRPASRLGELGAHLIAAVALVLPGIGTIVADGPLAAGLGEAAGHLAGGLAPTLEQAGVPRPEVETWCARIADGAVLVGAHVRAGEDEPARRVLEDAGAAAIAVGSWPE